MYRVITDLDSYTQDQFNEYRDILEVDSMLIDTLQDDTIFYNPVQEGTEGHEIGLGDIVTIKLHAHYVETDTAYVSGFPGRSFFPINNSGDSIQFEYGLIEFPITEMIHIAVDAMDIGEKWEVLCPAYYAYGSEGFLHPIMGTIIVPAGMPVHYSIELVGYE